LTIVTPSSWLASLVRESFLKEYRVKVIANGVDIQQFYPCHQKDASIPIVLGVAKPWSKRKGLDDFKALRKLIPDSIKIVLIGLTEKQINNLPSGIEGYKAIESIQKLVAWYCRAAIFVNPTHEDNFPTTNLEALACGTPVITYDTGGSPEAVTDRTGFVVAKGDVNQLAEAVKMFIDKTDNEKWQACRERAEKYFNASENFSKYIHLYGEMVKS